MTMAEAQPQRIGCKDEDRRTETGDGVALYQQQRKDAADPAWGVPQQTVLCRRNVRRTVDAIQARCFRQLLTNADRATTVDGR